MNILKPMGLSISKGKAGTMLLLAALLFLKAPGFAGAADFYVDPDYPNSGNGSAYTPWSSLDASATGAWDAINKALASSDVTVYFSARKAGTTQDQPASKRISIRRTSTSTYRLTLDGMSKYNSNDLNPVWANNTGSSRYSLTTSSYSIEAGFGAPKKNYVTVRGFKAKTTGQSQAFYFWGGDHLIVENNDFQAATSVALFDYAHRATASDTRQNGGCTDITFRNNVIHDSKGEGLYIGGSSDTGRPAHSNVTIEGNLIYNTGILGGQGDCIDLKDGLSNVVVRNNICRNGKGSSADGITSHSAARIENNVITGMEDSGIIFNTYWGRGYSGIVVKNNLVFKNGGPGVTVSTGSTAKPVSNVLMDHNTITGNQGAGIAVGSIGGAVSGVNLTNNIVYANAGYGIRIPGDVSNSISNNDVYGNGSGNYSGVSNQTNNKENISSNPLFINPGSPMGADGKYWTGDDGYLLSSNSPAIAASTSNGPLGALSTTWVSPPMNLTLK